MNRTTHALRPVLLALGVVLLAACTKDVGGTEELMELATDDEIPALGVSIAEHLQGEVQALTDLFAGKRFLFFPLVAALLWSLSRAVHTIVRLFRRVGLDRGRSSSEWEVLINACMLLLFVYIVGIRLFRAAPLLTIALISAAILAISLAFPQTLQNFAASVRLASNGALRPGTQVSIVGSAGVVAEHRLGYVVLRTEDGQLVSIPARSIASEPVTTAMTVDATLVRVCVPHDATEGAGVELIRQLALLSPYRHPATDVFVERQPAGIEVEFRVWSREPPLVIQERVRESMIRSLERRLRPSKGTKNP